ncbi:MAG: aminomethyl-transferring glycine dehydrogenase [Microthrixaceae bacterium]
MTDPTVPTPLPPTGGDFLDRHLGPDPAEIATMLEVVGQPGLEALAAAALPAAILDTEPLGLTAVPSESDALDRLREVAAENTVLTSLIGCGYSSTVVPHVILRNVLENPGWYTAYTPYQPEISQGRLEALLNFQTVVTDLTGMDIANASLLDEATAAAEAMTLARRHSKVAGDTFFVDGDCHPQVREVVATRAEPLGIKVVVGDPGTDLEGHECFGVLLAHPGSSGAVTDRREMAAAARESGAVVCVAADLLALTLLEPPGSWGADVVVGSAQRFGVPLGYGGPHAGFMAVREPMKRALPGRLVGVSVDAEGRRALRLALQTREQHIRREKATSNICTAQVLLAVMAGLYAAWHGPEGLTAIARRTHALTTALVTALRDAGWETAADTWFDTITLRVPGRGAEVVAAARAAGINLRPTSPDLVGIALDETTTPEIVATLLGALGVTTTAAEVATAAAAADHTAGLPEPLRRTTGFLEHPTFHRYRSETEMMRYLRRLEDKDLALDRTMIPLGSCTMKLNAAAEMIPVTWPEFAELHPFAPADQAAGYRRMIDELEGALVRITGYAAVSFQPNAGSQGEFAGLLAIRAYHRSRGDVERDICLIPASAHGTNAASAVMAGMRVVVVATDDEGNVDLDDLRAKAAEAGDRLAAAMVTYPSTHGVFETGIVELCEVVHDHGGQVYVDGANLNALVGLARPGGFGADVSHLNLHKTFCIPHGGGGPGVGPVAVAEHLVPFLPGHGLGDGPAGPVGAVSSAPHGSAGILPIPWMYVTMMGDRLRTATEVALLTANYVAARLRDHYPVLYSGPDGLVAHECIIDLRGIERDTGISNEDVAKRLIDYGFHAPTMSFPVPGTLMIEPTESEGLVELDRFCDAMIAIRAEIERVATGEWPADDNPLVHAPHTADAVGADDWDRAYPRSVAGWPVASLREWKYWPPVARIDGGYGDRNLVCSCPAIEDLAED